MAKTKKITVSAFENAVKKNFKNIVEEEWCGLQVVITPTISLQEVFNLVADVSTNSFSSDGEFIPEAVSALLYCGIVEKYTNISLPEDITEKYELVVKSGIIDLVLSNINAMQYEQITDAIRDKVDYMCDRNISEFNNSISQIVGSVKSLKERLEHLFVGVNENDVKSFINKFSESANIDKFALAQYKNSDD